MWLLVKGTIRGGGVLIANFARHHSLRTILVYQLRKRRERISVVAIVVIISDGGGSRSVVHWFVFGEF